MKSSLSHVAILVPSLTNTLQVLNRFNYKIDEAQEWEHEGTREVYVEAARGNSLLLIEAIKAGPYQRALVKRGPGLHHLAIDVLALEEFLVSLTGSGWLIHPMSLETIKQSRTAWLARPGFPALIEVQEKKKLQTTPLFVDGLSLNIKFEPRLLQAIGAEALVTYAQTPVISLEKREFTFAELIC